MNIGPVLKFLNKVYKKVNPSSATFLDYSKVHYKNQDAGNYIKKLLMSSDPVMIGRFGSVELRCLANYYSIKNNKSNYLDFIKGKIPPFWWDSEVVQKMNINAGFFPPETVELEKFSKLILEDIKEVDVLGSWLSNERFFDKELSNVVKVQIGDLHPYNHKEPYTSALKGKKVLVVHPFEESIKRQFAKREVLFKNPDVLPDFELKTVKAVQSIANSKTNFANWFEALDDMKSQISQEDFDIAIIGCGAYGFPLAAHVKRLGKKALHLGGVTQVLFGITGRRWETDPVNSYITKHFLNEHWVRPLKSETPSESIKVEDACYW